MRQNTQSAKLKKKSTRKEASSKKNISLPSSVQKVVGAIVEPLKKIARRMHKKDDVDVPFAETSSISQSTLPMKFFYSSDRFIDTFDDTKIYEQICKNYPALHESQKNLQNKRKAIVEMLKNEEYMHNIKDNYGMNAFDFVAFLFRLCPSLFKGIFVKKVQNVIKNTQYAKQLKKHKYRIAKACWPRKRRRYSCI